MYFEQGPELAHDPVRRTVLGVVPPGRLSALSRAFYLLGACTLMREKPKFISLASARDILVCRSYKIVGNNSAEGRHLGNELI